MKKEKFSQRKKVNICGDTLNLKGTKDNTLLWIKRTFHEKYRGRETEKESIFHAIKKKLRREIAAIPVGRDIIEAEYNKIITTQRQIVEIKGARWEKLSRKKNARLIRDLMRAAVRRRKLRENFTRKNKIVSRI